MLNACVECQCSMPMSNANLECQCPMPMSNANVECQCPVSMSNVHVECYVECSCPMPMSSATVQGLEDDVRLNGCSCFVRVRVRAERLFVFGACSAERMFSSNPVRAEHLFMFGEQCSGPALLLSIGETSLLFFHLQHLLARLLISMRWSSLF